MDVLSNVTTQHIAHQVHGVSNMSKEERKPEEQPPVVNTSLISGKSPEIVNLPTGAPPIVPSPPVEGENAQPQEDKTPSLIEALIMAFNAKTIEGQFVGQEQPVPAQEEEPVRASDKTVKGGRYIVAGQLVNANGDPIKE
jgi:hypothetical protein